MMNVEVNRHHRREFLKENICILCILSLQKIAISVEQCLKLVMRNRITIVIKNTIPLNFTYHFQIFASYYFLNKCGGLILPIIRCFKYMCGAAINKI